MLDNNLLHEAHLRYISDTTAGFSRKKNKEDFSYFNLDGKKITKKEVIERITLLAIPPAWEQVWICPYTNGHLQATGIDSKGRKQYCYHARFIEISQENKFQHLLTFIAQLPAIRQKVSRDIETQGISKEKVLATIVWLLEKTLIRIGNEEYEKENHSYGLTTLKNRHVTVEGAQISFSFKGKSGIYHEVDIKSKKVARIIKKLQDLPGQELFSYKDPDKTIQSIDSSDVNEYLKQITGEDVTAKDFRTWSGTFLAAKLLDKANGVETITERKKLFSTIVKTVAKTLRNLPTTSRKYYIHPCVFVAYTKGYTLSTIHTHKEYKKYKKNSDLSDIENNLVAVITIFT